MVLCSLESRGFRNLLPRTLRFHRGVNLLWGQNGAGKSNLLEAVYFLFTTCSFRTGRSLDLVAKGESGFWLLGEVETRSGSYTLGVRQEAGRRTLVLDGKKVGLEDVLVRFSVLAFSSRQMDILGGGPRERRRFLDQGILALHPGYLRELAAFRRTLAQRNRLLRGETSRAERTTWDDRFAAIAARLCLARRDYCSRLERAAEWYAGELSPPGGRLVLDYRPSPALAGAEELEDLKRGIQEALMRRRAEERRAGHTLVGPHRDEVRFLAGGMDLGRFGSAGQRRASLLALEVTRMELYREVCGEFPVLLVDDLDSDLDERTAEALLRRVHRTQAFVATCKDGSARRFVPPARPFRVSEGDVTPGAPEAPVALQAVTGPGMG